MGALAGAIAPDVSPGVEIVVAEELGTLCEVPGLTDGLVVATTDTAVHPAKVRTPNTKRTRNDRVPRTAVSPVTRVHHRSRLFVA